VTLDQIAEVDKDLLAARYEAAITEEFGALAKFLDMTIEAMIATSRGESGYWSDARDSPRIRL
jgi:hypothetical protein